MLTLEEEPERELPFNAVMTIYHLFYYAKPEAKVSGRFVPFREVKRAAPFDAAFKRNVLDAAARTFDGHLAELHRACQALDGRPLKQGDAATRSWRSTVCPCSLFSGTGTMNFRRRPISCLTRILRIFCTRKRWCA